MSPQSPGSILISRFPRRSAFSDAFASGTIVRHISFKPLFDFYGSSGIKELQFRRADGTRQTALGRHAHDSLETKEIKARTRHSHLAPSRHEHDFRSHQLLSRTHKRRIFLFNLTSTSTPLIRTYKQPRSHLTNHGLSYSLRLLESRAFGQYAIVY